MATLVTVSLLITTLAIFLSYRCVQISKLRNAYIVEDLPYQSQDLYNHMSNADTRPSMLRHMPPLTVHYMWCLKSHFEFKHYLSILSIAKVLRPDQIVFHYLELPLDDAKGYFTWFEDIQREVAMLSLKRIKDLKHCSHDFSRGVQENEDFPNTNGIFMMEDVAITNLTRDLYYHHTGALEQSSMSCTDSDGSVCDALMQKQFQLFLIPGSEPYSLIPGPTRTVFECPLIEAVNKAQNLSAGCLQLSQRLFPSDIWRLNKTFDRFAREVVFNNPEPVFAVPRPLQAAPLIAHIVKFDGEEGLSPLCYASIKSAFTRGELQHVFVHGHLNRRMQDPLWGKLVKHFHVTHIPTPSITASTSSQRQLLYGMYVLLQYGGVLLTCDTLVQKPLDQILQYPSVFTVKKSIYRIIHHHIDFSILAAHPASSFFQTLIPVLKQLADTGSDRDFGAVAYHVYEQHPASAWVEANLVGHLKCMSAKCLPAEGQLDVRQALAVKFSWAEGSPPSSLKDLLAMSTPLSGLLQDLMDRTNRS